VPARRSTAPSSQAAWKATRTLSVRRRCGCPLKRMPKCRRAGSCRRLPTIGGNLANDAMTEKSERRYQYEIVVRSNRSSRWLAADEGMSGLFRLRQRFEADFGDLLAKSLHQPLGAHGTVAPLTCSSPFVAQQHGLLAASQVDQFPAPSGWMKPYPFVWLNHLTVPVGLCAPARRSACGASHDRPRVYGKIWRARCR
jgi:hypothetical protein